jgi:hypothetical protein
MMTPLASMLRDETGTALLEALISLPVFAAVLAGTMALHATYSAKLEAKARGRRIAWLQADSGECPVRTCSSADCLSIEEGIRAGGLDALLSVRDDRFSLASLLSGVGRHLLGKATVGIGFAEASTPSSVRSGTTRHQGATTLLCNTTSRDTDTGASVLEYACATGLRMTDYAREVCK